MYTLIRANLPSVSLSSPFRGFSLRRPVSSTVLLLGLTSLFTDISSEMVSSTLPLYFIFYVGLTPLYFGIIDGLYQGLFAPLRLVGAYLSDRLRAHKETATFGYGISAVCKPAMLLLGGSWLPYAGVLFLDRSGKALRTGPRDAMISLTSESESLGTAFGVHRALDTLGALIGPLIAFGLLRLAAPGSFDSIFVVSFCFALIGVSIIGLLVEAKPAQREEAPPPRPSVREALGLARRPQLLRLVVIAGLLGLFTISDGFFYLVLQRRLDFDYGFFPLLYVGTACVYFVLAVPAGMLADRFGRGRVFAGGYLCLLLAYTALLRPAGGVAEVGLYLALLGAYYAATDGVLMAMASTVLPASLRASGLTLITTVTGLARFGGSVLFGLLWTWQGSETAIWVSLTGLAAGTLAVLLFLASRRDDALGN